MSPLRPFKGWSFCLLLWAALALFFSLKTPPRSAGALKEVVNATNSLAALRAPVNAAPNVDPTKGSSESKPDLSRFRFGSKWGEEENPILSAFSKWTLNYITAPPRQRAEMEPAGLALAQARRAEMKALIQTQPKAALAYAAPYAVRKELPPSIAANLEERISGKGDLLVLGRTDPVNSPKIVRRAVINQQTYEAFVFGARESQNTSTNISLHGVALDGQIALSDSPLRALEVGEPIPADKPIAATSCVVSKLPVAPAPGATVPAGAVAAESGNKTYWLCRAGHIIAAADGISAQETAFTTRTYANHGDRSILVMVVDFPDLPGGPVSPSAAGTNMQSVANFLAKSSYNDFRLSSRVITPVLRMPNTSVFYHDDPSGDSILLADARAAAQAAGYDTVLFDFDIVAFANIGMPFSGEAYIGGKSAWVQGALDPGVATHELGHNLGLHHANFWQSSTSAIAADGEHIEYGNDFDVMGKASNFPFAQYNANFKSLLGWLPAQNIITATNSGVYRLYAHDQGSLAPDRQYAIRIPAGFIRGGELEDYWLEFRQLFKLRMLGSDSAAIVFWGNDQGTPSASRLIDTHFTTPGKNDAPVALGETFIDAENGLQITPLSRQVEGDDVSLDVQMTRLPRASIPLGEALNLPLLSVSTSIDPWFGQQTVSHDGVSAVASASITNTSETWFEAALSGSTTVSFWWKVSSETNFDELVFTCDGQKIAAISGEVDWTQKSFELPSGSHTLRWTYKKDGSVASGADRAWVDQLATLSGFRAPNINSQPISLAVSTGDTAQFTVDAGGTQPLIYQWKVNRSGAVSEIPSATNGTLSIPNAQFTNTAKYFVQVSNGLGSIASSNATLTVFAPATMLIVTPTLKAGDLIASLQPLPATGRLVTEVSTNLLTWTPVATNELSSTNVFPLRRSVANKAEFVRARLQ